MQAQWFPKWSLREWRTLLQAVRTQSAIPVSSHVNDCLRQCVRDPYDAGELLETLFEGLLTHFGTELAPQSLAIATHLIGVEIPGALHPDLAIAHRKDVEYEAPMRHLFSVLKKRCPYLDLNSQEVVLGQMTFLKWLQGLAKYVLNNSFPVPVTAEGNGLVQDLLELSPQITDSLIGTFSARILLNMDEICVGDFSRSLVRTYAKMRQLPKLFSKLMLSLRNLDDVPPKKGPLSPIFLHELGVVIESSLPLGQVAEFWKTLLYHLREDAECVNVMRILADSWPVFLRHACIIDHTTPGPIVEKVAKLILETQALLKSALKEHGVLVDVNLALRELALAMRHYRGLELPDIFSGEEYSELPPRLLLKDHAVRQASVVHLFEASPDADMILRNLDLCLPHLTACQLFQFAKNVLNSKELEHRARLLQGEEVQENGNLQRMVLLSLIARLWDELDDVDPVCQEVLKPLSKKPLELIAKGDAEITKRLQRSFSSLERALSGGASNASLDAIYFALPLEALEVLPLESMTGNLHLMATLVACTLLSVSTHEYENDRLLWIIARCLDPALKSSSSAELFRYVDSAVFISWLSRLGYHSHGAGFETLQRLGCQIAVKFIHEFADKNVDFSARIKKVVSLLDNFDQAHIVHSSVIFLEALEAPLTFRDASDEKLAQCETHFKRAVKKLHTGLANFSDLPSNLSKSLATRALTATISILWAQHKVQKSEFPAAEWKGHVKTAFEHLIKNSENTLPEIAQRFFLVCLKARILPKKAARKIWSKLLSDKVWQNEKATSMVEAILNNTEASVMKEILDELSKQTLQDASLTNTVPIWKLIINCHLDNPELKQCRRLALEYVLPELQNMLPLDCSKSSDIEQYVIPLLGLEQSILDTEKPVVSHECEGSCLRTALILPWDTLTDLSFSQFCTLWKASYSIVDAGFHRRPSTLVIPRIPMVMTVVRNLVSSLIKAANQTQKVSSLELKDLSTFGHMIDRLFDHCRKHQADFVRISPLLLGDLIHKLASCTVYPAVRYQLMFAAYKLLDIMDKPGQNFLAVSLPEGMAQMLKQTVEKYNQYHKYTGKV